MNLIPVYPLKPEAIAIISNNRGGAVGASNSKDNQMTDLFTNATQNANRDTSLTASIVRKALAAGYSIRVEDAHGENQTTETRNANNISEAIGTSHATKLHIIDMRRELGKYVGGIEILHNGDADKINATFNVQKPDELAEVTADEPKTARRPMAHDHDPETAKNFPTWIDAEEGRIINKLFSAILANPEELHARIYDGEEFATHWTRDRKTLKAATAQTDYTVLHIRDERRTIGVITLIHGNGPDVISDWSQDSRDILTTLVNKANP